MEENRDELENIKEEVKEAPDSVEKKESEPVPEEGRKVTDEILEIINGDGDDDFIRTELDNYHENDIAEALTELGKADRIRLYRILGEQSHCCRSRLQSNTSLPKMYQHIPSTPP